ncbi:MAG: helical backbone metal receptor [bacterium]
MINIRRSAVLLFVLFLTAGAAHSVSFNRLIYPVKTKDASGDILIQKQPPARIISIDPAITEILFALNLSDKIVGVTQNCDYPEEAEKIASVGRDRVDIKKVVELKPDLVLANFYTQRSDIRKLRRTTLPLISGETSAKPIQVFTVDPRSLQDIYDAISTIGTVTNKEHSAYSLLQRMKRRVEWVEARAKKEKKLKALVIVKKRPLTAAGEGTYLYDLSGIAGFINAAPRGKMYPTMSRQEIIKADPDIIIAGSGVAKNPKDIYNDRNFGKTPAGRNKKAVCINADIFSRLGPRVVQALDEMAAFAYGWPREGDGN